MRELDEVGDFLEEKKFAIVSYTEALVLPSGTWELPQIVIVSTVGASTIGSIYVILTHFFFRHQTSPRRRLVVAGAFCSLCSALAVLADRIFGWEGALCAATGVCYIVFEVAAVCYIAAVAAYSHRAHAQSTVADTPANTRSGGAGAGGGGQSGQQHEHESFPTIPLSPTATGQQQGPEPGEGGGSEQPDRTLKPATDRELVYHLLVWFCAAVAAASVFIHKDPFPDRREPYELACFISSSNTLARTLHHAMPLALGIHFASVYYYFLANNVWAEVSTMQMSSQKGQGYALGAKEMKLLGSSRQKLSRVYLRISVTVRQFLLVLVVCHSAGILESAFRMVVRNEFVQWVYVMRVVSFPAKPVLFALVFEARGMFIGKYRNRLQKRARKHHQDLRNKMVVYDVGHRMMAGVTKQVDQMSKQVTHQSVRMVNMSDKFISGQIRAGADMAKRVGEKGAKMTAHGLKRHADSDQDSVYDSDEEEHDFYAGDAQSAAMLGEAFKMLKPRGPIVRLLLYVLRFSAKVIAAVLFFPIALTAWVPLYFLDEFVRGWRRRRGIPDMRPFTVYLFSLCYFLLLIAPLFVFSHVVSDRISGSREGFSQMAYSYLGLVYLFIVYGFWVNRFDPEMATIPDPRANNRVLGNWFEGLMGYGILAYEFVAFTSMSFLSNQVVSRMDGSLQLREEATDAMVAIKNEYRLGLSNVTWSMAAWLRDHESNDEKDIIDEDNTRILFLDFFHNNSYRLQFFSMYALVIVWTVMWVVPIVVRIMWSPKASLELVAMPLGPFTWSLIQFFLSDLSFLAIARGLLAAVDCSHNELLGFIQLDAMSQASIVPECWTGDHLWFSSLALFGLYFYLPTATLGKITEYTPGQDMRWIPLWVRVDLFARSLLLLLVLHTDSNRTLAIMTNVVVVGVHAGLLWCILVMRPCCVFWANWAKIVIHSSSIWSSAVALSIVVFDIRSVPVVVILNTSGWAVIWVYLKIRQKNFILIDKVMRRDKQADGSMPREMQVASIERIESLKRKLGLSKKMMNISQWCHHSLVLELICFCQVQHPTIRDKAFEAFTKIAVSPAADSFMGRCPIDSVVKLLMKNITPSSHPFRKLFTSIKILAAELSTTDFHDAMASLLQIVSHRLSGNMHTPAALQHGLGGWSSPEACLDYCGFDLTGQIHGRTTIAEVQKLKVLLALAKDNAKSLGKGGVRTSILNDQLKAMERGDDMQMYVSERKTCGWAARAMVGFTRQKQFREKLIEAGIVEILCTLLDEDSSNLQVDVMKCLMHLTEDDSNHLVLPASEVLPNIRLWIAGDIERDIVALHTATAIVARISRRCDLVYYIEQERMLELVIQKGVEMHMRICLAKGWDEGDRDTTLIPVHFHLLPDKVKGLIDSRFVANLTDLGLSENQEHSRTVEKEVQRWERSEEGAQLNVPSYMLDHLRMQILENILIIMAEVAFHADLRISLVNAGAIALLNSCMKNQHFTSTNVTMETLHCCKNLLMEPFGLEAILRDSQLAEFYHMLWDYKFDSGAYMDFDRTGRLYKRDLVLDTSLSESQRQQVHIASDFLGLEHRSVGSGQARRVEVSDAASRKHQVYSVGILSVTIKALRNIPQFDSKVPSQLMCQVVHASDDYLTKEVPDHNPIWNPLETFNLRCVKGEEEICIRVVQGDRSAAWAELFLDTTGLQSEVGDERWYPLQLSSGPGTSLLPTSPELLLSTIYKPNVNASVLIELQVIEARGLLFEVLKPDTYCSVVLADQEAWTRVVDQTTSPVWAETFVLAANHEEKTTIVVTLFNYYTLHADESLGKVDLDLTGMVFGKEYTRWHKLERASGAHRTQLPGSRSNSHRGRVPLNEDSAQMGPRRLSHSERSISRDTMRAQQIITDFEETSGNTRKVQGALRLTVKLTKVDQQLSTISEQVGPAVAEQDEGGTTPSAAGDSAPPTLSPADGSPAAATGPRLTAGIDGKLTAAPPVEPLALAPDIVARAGFPSNTSTPVAATTAPAADSAVTAATNGAVDTYRTAYSSAGSSVDPSSRHRTTAELVREVASVELPQPVKSKMVSSRANGSTRPSFPATVSAVEAIHRLGTGVASRSSRPLRHPRGFGNGSAARHSTSSLSHMPRSFESDGGRAVRPLPVVPQRDYYPAVAPRPQSSMHQSAAAQQDAAYDSMYASFMGGQVPLTAVHPTGSETMPAPASALPAAAMMLPPSRFQYQHHPSARVAAHMAPVPDSDVVYGRATAARNVSTILSPLSRVPSPVLLPPAAIGSGVVPGRSWQPPTASNRHSAAVFEREAGSHVPPWRPIPVPPSDGPAALLEDLPAGWSAQRLRGGSSGSAPPPSPEQSTGTRAGSPAIGKGLRFARFTRGRAARGGVVRTPSGTERAAFFGRTGSLDIEGYTAAPWSARSGRDFVLVGPAAECNDPAHLRQVLWSIRQQLLDSPVFARIIAHAHSGADLKTVFMCVDIVHQMMVQKEMRLQLGTERTRAVLAMLHRVLYGPDYGMAVLASKALIAALVPELPTPLASSRKMTWKRAITSVKLMRTFTKSHKKRKKGAAVKDRTLRVI